MNLISVFICFHVPNNHKQLHKTFDRYLYRKQYIPDQERKSLFMGNFLEWVKAGLKDVHMSSINFVNWLGCK